MSKGGYLPYGRHVVDDADIAAVTDVLRGDWLTTGPTVNAFETAFAKATGAAHAVSCANGTAALHLAAMALGLGTGDAVVVPSVTFLATANAVRFVDREVQFADVDRETGLLTPETLEAAIAMAAGRAKAVLPVHLNGQRCDMAGIAAVAARHGLVVVEDACHVLGENGAGACAHSAMSAFSLHPVKAIAAGEGGVVTTNDPTLAEQVARFRNHGMVREPGRFIATDDAFDNGGNLNPWYYEMPELGFNYRLSDIHAALGLSQLAKLDRFIARRRALAARYDSGLAALAPWVRPIGRMPGQDPAWHIYVVLIDFEKIGKSRAAVMNALRAKDIGTQVHYIPVHRQPYYRARYGAFRLPGADAYYARALSLPLFPSMRDADVDRVIEALHATCPMP